MSQIKYDIPKNVQGFYNAYIGQLDFNTINVWMVDKLPLTPPWGTKAQGKTLNQDVYILGSFFSGGDLWTNPAKVALIGHELCHTLQFKPYGWKWLFAYLWNMRAWEDDAYANQAIMEASYAQYFQMNGLGLN